MKKIIALVLSIVLICCFAVTAFAAESPVATKKATVTVRKAAIADSVGKVDTEFTVETGDTVTVKAENKYGTFNSWSIYKEVAATTTGMITLNVAAATKYVEAVEGVDYEIVSGSLTSSELTVKLNSSVIICGNYDNVKTDPSAPSVSDSSDKSPATNDMTVAYAVIVMLAVAAFGFGLKKVYSK